MYLLIFEKLFSIVMFHKETEPYRPLGPEELLGILWSHFRWAGPVRSSQGFAHSRCQLAEVLDLHCPLWPLPSRAVPEHLRSGQFN